MRINVNAERESNNRRLRRPKGAVVLRPVSATALEDVLTRAIAFWKFRQRERDWVPTNCPEKHAQVFLSRAGDGGLPELVGIVEAPCLRPDGSIFDEPGYDDQTGLYLYSGRGWPVVPERPTQLQVEEAVRVLLEPFGEFPHISDADRSVLISAILTTIQRRLLFSAPLHGFDAPLQGSGKSLQTDCVSLIATGRPPVCISAPEDEAEWRKLITTVLVSGDLILSIDNLVKPLWSATLAKALTQPMHDDRILSTNQKVSVPTNAIWLATANNLALSHDMPSRSIISRIDPKVERPEERKFAISDLRTHVLANRPRLVQAALTILKAHQVARRPQQGLREFGRFEQWSREIRAAIVYAGLPDPCITRERIVADDPERDSAAAVLGTWHDRFGDTPKPLQIVIEAAQTDPELRTTLMTVAADYKEPSVVDPRRLAHWCRSHTDRVIAGFCLMKAPGPKSHTGGQLWVVTTPYRDSSRGDSAESAESAESVSDPKGANGSART